MELLFSAIVPGFVFGKDGTIALPAQFPRRLRWRLLWTATVCDAIALLRHGRTLRLLSPARRQRLVQGLADHPWRWLRESLTLARAMALLTCRRRPT